ncbi:NAD(P)/FAD-dependent oxidoreductase [Streptomyces sp. NPDC050658]|uniref:NAD(P)/FAD-dependent oxidoreductase n=1 Tax=unclassified Streptomyces TaxID=2593676 RepID=UPI003411F802
MRDQRRRTAVVGSGVAGLTAAYILRSAHRVVLYEADDRLGGHAHTHDVAAPDGRIRGVDSGFIVHNDRTYPHLLRLFHELGVATRPTEMSMSVRCEGCGLEYAGARGPRGLFARPRNALRRPYLRMLRDVPRFHRRASEYLAQGSEYLAQEAGAGEVGITLGEFLAQHRFPTYFVRHFAVPLVSAVWSCPPGTALRYPARHLFRFLDHHGMLSVSGSPNWRTVDGGSREYVTRIGKELQDVRTSTPVRSVRRDGAGVCVTTEDGTADAFDSVVIAVHADQALRLLADPSGAEREVLGAFRYSPNPAVLHTDTAVLPRSPGARASWNCLLPSCRVTTDHVRVSYDMNRLQGLDSSETYVVTLGGEDRIRPDRVLARMAYEHPVYTAESVGAQERLASLSGPVTAFAGAYQGWGFHEDGCRSGVDAARTLGVRW